MMHHEAIDQWLERSRPTPQSWSPESHRIVLLFRNHSRMRVGSCSAIAAIKNVSETEIWAAGSDASLGRLTVRWRPCFSALVGK